MKGRYQTNTRIEELIAEKDAAGQSYSAADKQLIARYSGAGGLSKQGAKGRGVLHEFYTPDYLAEFMWEMARHYGYTEGGRVLEPSAGTGRVMAPAPKGSQLTAFETNKTSARILEILFPDAEVHNQYFETAFLELPRLNTRMPGYSSWLEPFDLVIGNPPFGQHRNFYSGHFKTPKFVTTEIFFIYHGLQLLRTGGILIYIVPSQFIRNGYKYHGIKELVAQKGTLLGGYRLPSVFKGTKVPVDILAFKRK